RGLRDGVVAGAAVLAVVAVLAALEGAGVRGGATGRSVGRPAGGGATGLTMGDTLDTGRRGALGDAVVLRVRSAVPDFWRAGSYDEWDGRSWRRSRRAAGPLGVSEVAVAADPWAATTVATTPLDQMVTVE